MWFATVNTCTAFSSQKTRLKKQEELAEILRHLTINDYCVTTYTHSAIKKSSKKCKYQKWYYSFFLLFFNLKKNLEKMLILSLDTFPFLAYYWCVLSPLFSIFCSAPGVKCYTNKNTQQFGWNFYKFMTSKRAPNFYDKARLEILLT